MVVLRSLLLVSYAKRKVVRYEDEDYVRTFTTRSARTSIYTTYCAHVIRFQPRIRGYIHNVLCSRDPFPIPYQWLYNL